MSSEARRLYEEALKLAESERADLAAFLLDSLDGGADEEVESAWKSEIGKRIEQIDSGAVTPIPWPEARRMILGNTDGRTDS